MEPNKHPDAFKSPSSFHFSQHGRYLTWANDKGSFVYDLEGSHDQVKLIMAPGADSAGEGCGLAATEMSSAWVSTGNDSSPENSSRLVRSCDASGAILGYRMTTTPILSIRVFKPENWSDDKAIVIIVTQLNIFVYDSDLEQCKLIIDTESNPHGAIAVSAQEPFRLAYPCPSVKGVKVATVNGEEVTYLHGTFSSPLQLLSFSPSGRKLAATDQDGLTVYSLTFPDGNAPNGLGSGFAPVATSTTATGAVKSYRRGTQKCKMTSLAYNPRDEDILCCSSDHGTTHVFNINPSTSLLSMAGTVLWNFQIKDDAPKVTSAAAAAAVFSSASASLPMRTSWCSFSTDGNHLYRIVDGRLSVYQLDLNTNNAQQRPGAALLIVKDLNTRK